MRDFSALVLPDTLRRVSALKPKYRPEGYLDDFDADTLWYDAIWVDGRVHLVCPPLNNLWPLMRRARIRLDGAPARIARRRRYKRHEVIEIAAPRQPAGISLYLDDWRGESPVGTAAPEAFVGLNTMFYISRNNDLRWLVDHARFHRDRHGAQALIVIDNGSDTYESADIAAALAPLDMRVRVLNAPFKYGPVGLPPFRRLEKFLQTALFNVLRLRFLGQARAILSVDVDEMVLSDGASIFDAAHADRLGFVQIRGQWHYPAPGQQGPFSHADHTHVADPPAPCPTKWCLDPTGPLGGWSWDIHGIERLPLLHARTHRAFRFAHCRGVTTGWKNLKRLSPPEGTRVDETAAHLLGTLGGA